MQGLGMFNDAVLRQARQGGASPDVVSAVRQASASTGVDFSYLMEKAAVESGFNPDAKAASSSATGLYQFTDSTWLGIVAKHGQEHGLGNLASSISVNADGSASVSDIGQRQKILDLRRDPATAATMAAELARDNKSQLESSVGGSIGGTELYLAHFLGAGGAAKFLDAYRQNPNQSAASILPSAASSNPGVFTDTASGKPCTLAQVYDRFAAHFGGDATLAGGTTSCDVPANVALAGLNPSGIAAPGITTGGAAALGASLGATHIASPAASLAAITGPDGSQNLADRAVPGVGGPTLSLYAILTLASLGMPAGQDNETGITGKPKSGSLTETGKLLLGI